MEREASAILKAPNDDVNKFIWSDQDWNPHITVEETLQDYARFFIGPDHAKAIAEGILDLEENLRGPLLSSEASEQDTGAFPVA
jgi:hypothetical protein